MLLKSLNWKRTSFRKLKSPKSTTETWIAETGLFGQYKVFRAISGNTYIEIPQLSFHKDSDVIFWSNLRRKCESIKDGKNMAELDWKEKASLAFVEVSK